MGQEDDKQAKGKRPDRVAKLKERKLYKETVIKSCLRKYLCQSDHKDNCIEAIQNRVESFSKAYHLASVSLSGIVKECFDGVEDVREVSLPDFIDPTFFRQLMLGTEDATKPFSEIVSYYNNHPELVPNHQRYPGDRNIYSYGASQYITNLKNSIVMNFEGRVKGFLKKLQKLLEFSKDERILAYYAIMGWKVPFKLEETIIENEELQMIIEEQRSILGLEDTSASVNQTWLKSVDNQLRILKQWVYFNRFYKDYEFKQFNIIPIASIRNKFITIDSCVLYGILKEVGIIDCNSKEFIDMEEDQWSSFLNTSKYEKTMKKKSLGQPRKEFTNIINTDGISVCAHFREKKTENELNGTTENVIIDPKHDRIVACDPGRVNIYMFVEVVNGKIISNKLTRNQYYAESGHVNMPRSGKRTLKLSCKGCQRLL